MKTEPKQDMSSCILYIIKYITVQVVTVIQLKRKIWSGRKVDLFIQVSTIAYYCHH